MQRLLLLLLFFFCFCFLPILLLCPSPFLAEKTEREELGSQVGQLSWTPAITAAAVLLLLLLLLLLLQRISHTPLSLPGTNDADNTYIHTYIDPMHALVARQTGIFFFGRLSFSSEHDASRDIMSRSTHRSIETTGRRISTPNLCRSLSLSLFPPGGASWQIRSHRRHLVQNTAIEIGILSSSVRPPAWPALPFQVGLYNIGSCCRCMGSPTRKPKEFPFCLPKEAAHATESCAAALAELQFTKRPEAIAVTGKREA